MLKKTNPKAILNMYVNARRYHKFELDLADRDGVIFSLWWKMGNTLLILDVMGLLWPWKDPCKTRLPDAGIIRYQISLNDWRDVVIGEVCKDSMYKVDGPRKVVNRKGML